MLPLLYAHLFSLSLMRDVFARQVAAGQDAAAANWQLIAGAGGGDEIMTTRLNRSRGRPF